MIAEQIKRVLKPVLTEEQKKRFREYYPDKICKVERNIAIVVAVMQACMMVVFSLRDGGPFQHPRSTGYFVLYVILFAATVDFIPIYLKWMRAKKYHAVSKLRRAYVFIMCSWCIGITVLDQMGGNGLGVYCYLIPTMAALLLLTPLECSIIFGLNWAVMMAILAITRVNADNLFANVINGTFVTILAVFISIRYYRSMAVEFRDREIIASQYEEIQKANDLLNQMAYTDQLTGLHNRRFLTEEVFDRFSDYRNRNFYGEFIMLDIDLFKQYNDTYGHLQGDDCLKKVAAILKMYDQDKQSIVIRYGGEEFLMIRLTEQQEEDMRTAERVREQIRGAKIFRSDIECDRVTVSLGVWQGYLQEVEWVETAIHYADEALYDAKNAGRDCICWH